MRIGPGTRTSMPAVRWDPAVEAYFTACFGGPRLAAMSTALARPSLTPTLRVNTLKASPEEVVKRLLETETELRGTYGPRKADQAPSEQRRSSPRLHPHVPAAVVLTGQGPQHIEYGNGDMPEVVINRFAAEAVLKGAQVYAPGLLAASPGIAEGDLVAVSAALERPIGLPYNPGNASAGTSGTVSPSTSSDSPEHRDACLTAAWDGAVAAGASSGASTAGVRMAAAQATALRPETNAKAPRLAVGISRGAVVAQDGSVPLAWSRQRRRNVPAEPLPRPPPVLQQQHLQPQQPQDVEQALPAKGEAGLQYDERAAWRIAPVGHRRDVALPVSRNTYCDGDGDQTSCGERSSIPSSSINSSSDGGASLCPSGRDHESESSEGSDARGHGVQVEGSDSNTSGDDCSQRSDRMLLGFARAAAGRRAMFRAQEGLALRMERRLYDIPSCNGILPGLVMLQALPSIVAAQVLSPRPGSRVIDMCAAPGGKTTLLAAIMGDRGRVVGLDRTAAKVDEIMSLARDFGATCVEAYKADATEAVKAADAPETRWPEQLASEPLSEATGLDFAPLAPTFVPPLGPPPYPAGSFDYVLLDPPCSALGLRPRLLHSWTMPQLRAMAAYQRSLIHTAVRLLAPGGEMVYCTCTINPDENEANVAWALDRFAGTLGLLPAEPLLGLPGLTRCDPMSGSRWLSADEAPLVQRFDPGLLLSGRRLGPAFLAGSPSELGHSERQDDRAGRCGEPELSWFAHAAEEASDVRGRGSDRCNGGMKGSGEGESDLDEWQADDVMGFFIARFRKLV